MKRLLLLTVLLLSIHMTHAQTALDDCRDHLASILARYAADCTQTGIDHLCLGVGATFEPRPNASDVTRTDALNQVGAGGFNPAEGVYGLVSARLEEGLWLAFGDAIVDNLSTMPGGFRRVQAGIGANGAWVRALPQADGRVIGALYSGDTAAIIAQSADGEWLRVAYTETEAGWINAGTLRDNPPANLLILTEDSPFAPPFYAPMQALQARFDTGQAPCDGLMTAGLLLQADTGKTFTLQLNGVRMETNGTALVSALEDRIWFESLEGDLSLDGERIAQAGESLHGILNTDGSVTLIAGEIDYAWVRVRTAPLDLLPRPVDLPFSTAELLTPFEPGTGFLTSMLPSDPCVIVWTTSVNLRAGPGTNYPVQASVLENLAASADARAQGTDGVMWWRITEAVWVRSDNTTFGGDCASLPFIDPPPLR